MLYIIHLVKWRMWAKQSTLQEMLQVNYIIAFFIY
jgi:hypothetical protein